MRELNPQYLRLATPPGARVGRPGPGGARPDARSRRTRQLPAARRVTFLEHIVRAGETLSGIARAVRREHAARRSRPTRGSTAREAPAGPAGHRADRRGHLQLGRAPDGGAVSRRRAATDSTGSAAARRSRASHGRYGVTVSASCRAWNALGRAAGSARASGFRVSRRSAAARAATPVREARDDAATAASGSIWCGGGKR